MLGYKNILVGVGAIALATTPVLVLSNSSNINNKYNKIEKNIGQIEKQVLQYQTFYQNSKLNNALANVKNLKDGVNEWNYYFVWGTVYILDQLVF